MCGHQVCYQADAGVLSGWCILKSRVTGEQGWVISSLMFAAQFFVIGCAWGGGRSLVEGGTAKGEVPVFPGVSV